MKLNNVKLDLAPTFERAAPPTGILHRDGLQAASAQDDLPGEEFDVVRGEAVGQPREPVERVAHNVAGVAGDLVDAVERKRPPGCRAG